MRSPQGKGEGIEEKNNSPGRTVITFTHLYTIIAVIGAAAAVARNAADPAVAVAAAAAVATDAVDTAVDKFDMMVRMQTTLSIESQTTETKIKKRESPSKASRHWTA